MVTLLQVVKFQLVRKLPKGTKVTQVNPALCYGVEFTNHKGVIVSLIHSGTKLNKWEVCTSNWRDMYKGSYSKCFKHAVQLSK